MVKKFKSWLNICLLTLILVVPGLIFATNATAYIKNNSLERLDNVATKNGPYTAPATETTLATMLGLVISVALSILGVIFIFITILAGYQWMTAQGNEQSITKAKESMTRAIIGLIVVIASYAIWTFIKLNFIQKL
jgi:cytochrome bd-type quinol oxidase subunit 2